MFLLFSFFLLLLRGSSGREIPSCGDTGSGDEALVVLFGAGDCLFGGLAGFGGFAYLVYGGVYDGDVLDHLADRFLVLGIGS